ncbi:hypothetical protein QM565_21310 [Geitlerinema splendidum]|nr:hypothetical protein [Geitlerinema splendidum]
MTEFYLVLIETSGNQNYIFSTNRLRENIGASELTYQAGTYWVVKAVATQNKEILTKDWRKPEQFRQILRDDNPPLENSNRKAEVIVAASGKALILAKDKCTAKAIISEVTRKALIEAPGLDIAGVYESFTWSKDNSHSLAQTIKKVHQKFEEVRSRRPSPENRFLRLPIVASCAVSGLPASQIDTLGKKQKLISQVSFVKCNIARKAQERLTNLDKRLQKQIDQLLREEDSKEEKRSWLAVVHADGNGLGQIFLNFEKYIGTDKSPRNYINKYREFSLALDECTEAAFQAALDVFPEEENIKNKKVTPIVPLIIGGDDLTVVCDGQYALEFTRVFLQEFETQTKNKEAIREIAQQAFGTDYLSACAGVAIIKRHFPFSVAYELAEDLIKSAKVVKKKVTKKGDKNTPFPCSAIDFHILYGTSGIELKEIREKLQPEKYTKLYNRPYVVTSPKTGKIEAKHSPDKEDIGGDWIEPRKWEVLAKWIEFLNRESKPLPSSQAHALRTALFLGKDETESQIQLIQNRYGEFKKFLEDKPLFREENSKESNEQVKTYQITSFLDALDAMEFLENNQTNQSYSKAEEAV